MSNFGNVAVGADQIDPLPTPSTVRAMRTRDRMEDSRLKKMVLCMRKKDGLDEAFYTSVEILLEPVPSSECTASRLDDISDMIRSFTPVQELLKLNFSLRITLKFSMFR